MGHRIDSLGYNRIYNDENFMWQELQKLYGPTTISMDESEQLRVEVKQQGELIEQLTSAIHALQENAKIK
jgi:hypothetical protein